METHVTNACPRAAGRGRYPGLPALALVILLIPGLPSLASDVDALDAAVAAYEDGHHAEALKRFEVAARRGNARAQEVLGFMYLNGKSIRGEAIPWDRGRAIYWFRKAALQDREVAQHMLCVLTGQPGDTVTRRRHCISRAAQ